MGEIRIYIADLAAYNNGRLHGTWIDATQDIKEIQANISNMLASSPIPNAEEYAIHDYEGFKGYTISEYEGIEATHELACFIEEHGEIAGELLNHCCGELEEARKLIEEQYTGCYSSLADYTQELTESATDIPDQIQYYIDYERMGKDMDMSGDIFTIETAHDEVHIFWNH